LGKFLKLLLNENGPSRKDRPFRSTSFDLMYKARQCPVEEVLTFFSPFSLL
jgi:hypothetical protein